MTDPSGVQAQWKDIRIVSKGSRQQRDRGRERSDHLDYIRMRLQLLPPKDRFSVQRKDTTDCTNPSVGSDGSQAHCCYCWNYFSLLWPVLHTKGFPSREHTRFLLHWKPHQKEIKAAQGGLQDCTLSKQSDTSWNPFPEQEHGQQFHGPFPNQHLSPALPR